MGNTWGRGSKLKTGRAALRAAKKYLVCKKCDNPHQYERIANAPDKCGRCGHDGFHKIASHAELTRYGELNLLAKSNFIYNLETQVTFNLPVNGQKVCKYIADFVYTDKNGKRRIEDVKGSKDNVEAVFKLKCKLFQAVTGEEINLIYRR